MTRLASLALLLLCATTTLAAPASRLFPSPSPSLSNIKKALQQGGPIATWLLDEPSPAATPRRTPAVPDPLPSFIALASTLSVSTHALQSVSRSDDSAGYDTYPIMKATPGSRAQLHYTAHKQKLRNGRVVKGYLGVLENPIGHFSFVPALGSHEDGGVYECKEAKTSDTAIQNNCIMATNAGFFNMDTGQCIGHLIHKDKMLQLDENNNRCTFGIDKSGHFVTGYLRTQDVLGLDGGFHELATGRGWLVRNATSYVNESRVAEGIEEHFVMEKAPRTGVGFDRLGRLMLYEVDGEEDIGAGVDMYEFAELFVTLGAINAVNLDGGGSSVTIVNGTVASKPTCNDTHEICERTVTTVACIY